MLTCTRSLDGGIEREQICLLCNAADDLNALADLLRALAECCNRGIDRLRARLDLLHVVHDFIDGAAPLAYALDGMLRHLSNGVRLFRHVSCMPGYRHRRSCHRGGRGGLPLDPLGDLGNRRGNMVGCLCRLMGCLREPLCRVRQLCGVGLDLLDQHVERMAHLCQAIGELPHLILRRNGARHLAQVATVDGLTDAYRLFDVVCKAIRDIEDNARDKEHNDEGQPCKHQQEVMGIRKDFTVRCLGHDHPAPSVEMNRHKNARHLLAGLTLIVDERRLILVEHGLKAIHKIL